jgi:hypothetical protein
MTGGDGGVSVEGGKREAVFTDEHIWHKAMAA